MTAEKTRALAFSAAAVLVAAVSAVIFLAMREPEPIVAGPGVTATRMLSSAEPDLAGGAGDTPIFELAGAQPGGTLLLLGGTHPSETAGMLAAVLFLENARVTKGKVLVVPQANRSGFTYTDPKEAHFHAFEIDTPGGKRWFRVGMRLTNPADQWPDPDVFVHAPSGERMIGFETRNLNRNHPGMGDAWLTARVSHGLTSLAKNANVVFDLHESVPESPNVNSMVAHERAFETAATANASLQGRRIPFALSASPKNLHGLSHREFGDATGAEAILTETVNPSRGRFRGRTSLELLLDGRDLDYAEVMRLRPQILRVRWDAAGFPLALRVARHLAAIEEILNAYNELHPEAPIEVEAIPPYRQVIDRGLGAFLQPPPKG